jgi:type I restriction enzyme M protein
MPPNLFYGTGIPACIVVMDKQDAHARKGIFIIDASAGFMKDGPKNRLRAQDIHKIVDVFNKRLEVPKYSRMVSFDEIEKNEFNLNIPRYIDSQTSEDIQDIEGHLRGGIPVVDVDALCGYWTVCPQLRETLFKTNRPGYVDLAVDKSAIKSTIYEHPQFAAFIASMNAHFAVWREKQATALRQLKAGTDPKEVIATVSEDLLAHYTGKPLINNYDVYQHLMDYWAETTQDDCYLIAADGWKAETSRVLETKKGKDGKPGKTVDKGWTCDLIPKPLLVARYFANEQAALDQLTAELESVTGKLAELEEEHGGDEGVFSDLERINKAEVSRRLREIEAEMLLAAPDGDSARSEADVLNEWLELTNRETELKRQIKEADAALDSRAYAKYPKLTETEIQGLVVDDKWLAELDAAIHGEMDRLSRQLTQRVRELAERYESPLPQLTNRVAELEAKVNGHLERMGFAWK